MLKDECFVFALEVVRVSQELQQNQSVYVLSREMITFPLSLEIILLLAFIH